MNGVIANVISEEGRQFLKLTELGKEALGVEEEWDGKYRIVIWDIPENKRRLRDLIRRKLKEYNFKIWQKSVWVSKRNVTKRLRKFILELKMEKWVMVIESDDPSLSHINFHDPSVAKALAGRQKKFELRSRNTAIPKNPSRGFLGIEQSKIEI